jgi:hypothetical protein
MEREMAGDSANLRNCGSAYSDVQQLLICAAGSLVVELILMFFLYEQSTSIAKTNHWLEVTQLPGARIADLLINRLVTTIWHGFAVTVSIQTVLFTSALFTFLRISTLLVRHRIKKTKHTLPEAGP